MLCSSTFSVDVAHRHNRRSSSSSSSFIVHRQTVNVSPSRSDSAKSLRKSKARTTILFQPSSSYLLCPSFSPSIIAIVITVRLHRCRHRHHRRRQLYPFTHHKSFWILFFVFLVQFHSYDCPVYCCPVAVVVRGVRELKREGGHHPIPSLTKFTV